MVRFVAVESDISDDELGVKGKSGILDTLVSHKLFTRLSIKHLKELNDYSTPFLFHLDLGLDRRANGSLHTAPTLKAA